MIPRPLNIVEMNLAEWFDGMAEHGVPVVVPCRMDGDPALASASFKYHEPRLRAYATDPRPRVRARVALDVCRRGYGLARQHGADVLIP